MAPDDVVIKREIASQNAHQRRTRLVTPLYRSCVLRRKTKIDRDVVRSMKAIACPECSAPIAHQGVAVEVLFHDTKFSQF